MHENRQFCFLALYAEITDDPLPPFMTALPCEIGDFSILAAHVTLAPNIKIGKHCLIGLKSTVNRNILDFSLAVGTSARRIKGIRKMTSSHFEEYYPWVNYFLRGLPWHDIGFNRWAILKSLIVAMAIFLVLSA